MNRDEREALLIPVILDLLKTTPGAVQSGLLADPGRIFIRLLRQRAGFHPYRSGGLPQRAAYLAGKYEKWRREHPRVGQALEIDSIRKIAELQLSVEDEI